MRRRLRDHSRGVLLCEQPLGEVDPLAQVADLPARLLQLGEQVLAQHLDLFACARVGAATNALRQGTNDGKRSEEHTSELQSPYVTSYAVFRLTKKPAPRTATPARGRAAPPPRPRSPPPH